MLHRLRPNVLILAGMATIAATGALWLVLHYLGAADVIGRLATNPELGVLLGLVIGATVGALVGSILTLAGQVATDPPPPAYPAAELPSLIRALRESDTPPASPPPDG